jgi:hypothetical protein
MKKIILAFVLVIALSGLTKVHSQNKPMTVPDILQKVMNWEGDWQANMTMKMGDKASTTMDYISFSKASDGMGVSAKEWMDSPMGGKYHATHLVGYNMEDKHLHWFSVDNMGLCQDALGEMMGDNHIRLSHSGKKDGKTMKSTVDLTIKDMNTVDFKLVVIEDGKTVQSMMGTFMRKSSSN